MSFMIGVVFGGLFSYSLFVVFCVALVTLFLTVVFFKSRGVRLSMLILLFIILGFGRFQISRPVSGDDHIYYYNDQQVFFEGGVTEVDRRIANQKLTISVERIDEKNVSGRVLATTSLYPLYEYGDKLSVSCLLKTPENFDGFNYSGYLAKDSIYSLCYYPVVSVTGYRHDFFYFIEAVKLKLAHSLNTTVKEPASSVLQALLLGNKRGIPRSILNNFSHSGLSHVIAISGMHIALIVMVIMHLAISLGIRRQKAFWITLLIIIFYVFLIGLPASAVRGATMALLVLYAKRLGRLSTSINSLLFAAFLMLMVNPMLLIYDIGFQLSFMAVLGILYLSPILKRKFKKLPEMGEVKSILIITLSAQLMTLPLIIFYFHIASLVSLLANILVLPAIPFLMIWSMAGVMVGLVSVWLGRILGLISWLGVSYIMKISSWLVGLPFSYLEFESFSFLLSCVLYLFIFIFVFKHKKLLI